MIKHNGNDAFLIRWSSSCVLMYINLTVIFTSKYVQKVTGKRGILTRHLTISCQIHIYVALRRTYRTATQSSPEKYMYITEDLPVNNTRRFFKKRPGLPHRSQPIRERWRRRAPPPTKRGGTQSGQWVGFKDSTSITHLNTRNKSKTRHFFLNLVDFFCFFFTPILLRQRFSTSTEAQACVFFSPMYTYILICYVSLSQFVRQRHAGEAGGGRRGGALVKVEFINTAGVCRCWWTPGIRWGGVFALLKTASGRKDGQHFKIRVMRLLIQAV